MCEICDLKSADPEKRTAMRDGLLANAERMERVANLYRQLAHREIDPHSQKLKDQMPLVNNAIRLLVEDFL